MFGYFLKIKKGKQIWFYLTALRDLLRKDHFTSQDYTPEQVMATLGELKKPALAPEYALAIWCAPEEFRRYYAGSADAPGYWALRGEIGNLYCQGNAQFDPRFLAVNKRGGDFGGSSESENLKWSGGAGL